jgi:hypothetical protein
VVERATAKDPAQRYQRIEEMIDDLQTALEVEAARAGATTGEATTVLDAVPPPRRKLSTRARWSWAGIIALLLIAGGTLLAVQLISSGEVGGGGGGVQQGSQIELAEATDFDPLGDDGEEHSFEVDRAIDGQPTTTAWSTESYTLPAFGKDGVGIYVEAEEPVAAGVLELRSPDPGWEFEVYAANEPQEFVEDWTPVADGIIAKERTEVSLDTGGRKYRYYLIWATSPAETDDAYGASISDVRLFA